MDKYIFFFAGILSIYMAVYLSRNKEKMIERWYRAYNIYNGNIDNFPSFLYKSIIGVFVFVGVMFLIVSLQNLL